MKVELPYGLEGLNVNLPYYKYLEILEPPVIMPAIEENVAINEAFNKPIGSKPLHKIAFKGATVSIAISDATRPNIEKKVLPTILLELFKAGVNIEDISFFVGTGSHRPATEEELSAMLGFLKSNKVKIINHDCLNSKLSHIGTTLGGFPVVINSDYMNGDIKIAVGTVLPHPIAGYSGGGKAVAVGLSGKETITSLHTPVALDHPNTGLGKIKNNPFLDYCYDASEMIGIDFLVNGIVNENEDLLYVVCGDVRAAHLFLLEKYMKKIFEVPFQQQADVVLVSVGHPKDNNLYHICAEGVCIVAGNSIDIPCVRPGGTIIIASPIKEGVYNEEMYRRLSSGASPANIVHHLKHENAEEPGMHRAYAVAHIMCKNEIIIANSYLDPEIIGNIGMRYMRTVEDALYYCQEKHGLDYSLMVVKNSHRIVPVQK